MLSVTMESAFRSSIDAATRNKHAVYTVEHLLLALLDERDAGVAFDAYRIDRIQLRTRLEEHLDSKQLKVKGSKETAVLSPEVEHILRDVRLHLGLPGLSHSSREATGLDVLASLYSRPNTAAAKMLLASGMTRQQVLDARRQFAQDAQEDFPNADDDMAHRWMADVEMSGVSKINERYAGIESAAQAKQHGQPPEAQQAFTRNMVSSVQEEPRRPFVGRERELDMLMTTLQRFSDPHVLLVGDHGVGKTSLVEEFASRVAYGNVPETLQNVRLLCVESLALMAGTRYRGDWEERVLSVVKEAERGPKTICFFDDIHALTGASKTSDSSVGLMTLIAPALRRGRIRVIGATTWTGLRRHMEAEPGAIRGFERIEVSPVSAKAGLVALKAWVPEIENHHAVTINEPAIETALRLSERFMPEGTLPDRALKLLDEASTIRASESSHPDDTTAKTNVSHDDVVAVLSRRGVIPDDFFDFEAKGSKDVEAFLKDRLFGQDEAVKCVADAIALARVGLGDVDRPASILLFAGATGVGKTELAKQAAAALGVELVRIDMSEYEEAHAVSRLIGAPPGYLGHDAGGILTDTLAKRPNCVLLLDEIEKAHSNIHHLFLQLLDYGRITDGMGRQVDGRRCFIVMTTNLGARESLKSSMGFNPSQHHDAASQAIEREFSPEFRNRVDRVVHFQPLGVTELQRVARKVAKGLIERTAARGVKVTVSSGVLAHVAATGSDEKMGARPIARTLNRLVGVPLAHQIAAGQVSEGSGVRVVMSRQGDVAFHVVQASKSRLEDDEGTAIDSLAAVSAAVAT